MNKNILIRCDASQSIGLGHITRCLVLANEFRKNGCKVFFAIKNNKLAIEKIIEQQLDMIIASDDNFDYFKWIEDIIEQQKIDIFIGDVRDGFPIKLISYMKNKNILTVAIDEPSSYAKECDLCFYPPHAMIEQKDYKGIVFQGFLYVVLRDQFYKTYKKNTRNDINILVMIGGTDPHHLTYPIIQKLLQQNLYQIHIVLSTTHHSYEEVTQIKSTNIHLHSNVSHIAQLISNMDLAIISFGMSVYEMIAMGVPAIHICLNEDHFRSSLYFDDIMVIQRLNKDSINDLCINLPINSLPIKNVTNEVASTILKFII